jgi:hypothetical protein
MSSAVYFAPTYFSPFYFPPVVAATQDTPGYRDRDAFAAIVAALSNTAEFADVVFGCTPHALSLGADRVPLALVVPTEWHELDDADPTVNIRRVTFTLTLVVRHESADCRFQLLDRLTSIVQNAIDGLDLNGGCLPNLTKLQSGLYESHAKHPEQRLMLTGSFSYLVSTNSAHDTTF